MTPTLLAYIHIDLAPTSLHIQGASNHVLVASLLAPSQVNNIERLMQWSIYDHFTLIAPSGEVRPAYHAAGLQARAQLTFGAGDFHSTVVASR